MADGMNLNRKNYHSVSMLRVHLLRERNEPKKKVKGKILWKRNSRSSENKKKYSDNVKIDSNESSSETKIAFLRANLSMRSLNPYPSPSQIILAEKFRALLILLSRKVLLFSCFVNFCAMYESRTIE